MVETVAKVVMIGAVLFGAGQAAYEAYTGSGSGDGLEKPVNEEEKKDDVEPAQYQLDPGTDIESLTCPITMEVV